MVVSLYASKMATNVKMPWIILILSVPIIGVGIYLIVGLNSKPHAMRKRYQVVDEVLMPLLMEGEQGTRSESALKKLEQWDEGIAPISRYIVRNSGYPLYQNSEITYYSFAKRASQRRRKQ